MATVIYSPGIRVVIETAGGNGIIDVSEDISSGQLALREEMPSSLRLTLLNHRRKYDGVFTPNDIISVQMKRVRWMPVFSGYLDQVPYFSAYQRNVQLTATCALKRLKYWPWDPGAQASVDLLSHARAENGYDNDGGMRNVLIAMLHNVGKWNYRNIHIGRLPEDWVSNVAPLREKVMAEVNGEGGPGTSGMSGVNNTSPGNSNKYPDISYAGSGGRKVVPRMATEDETTNTAITGLLGTNTARATVYGSVPENNGAIRADWYVRRPDDGGPVGMALTGEDPQHPKDEWYAQMRFPYTLDGANPPPGVTATDFAKSKKWWKNKTLLVSNPKNLTSVVVRAADWGGTEDSLAVSEHALSVIGATPGDLLDVRFAPEVAQPGDTFSKGDLPSPVARTTTTDDGGGGSGGGQEKLQMIWPVNGPLTAGFGESGTYWSSTHTGQDISVPTGTAVKAALPGTVTRTIKADVGGAYGNHIYIDHGKGVQTMYAHLSAIRVAEQQKVDQGSVIGLSGATGNVSGPHLHFEVIIDGVQVDPLPYLRGQEVEIDGTVDSGGGGADTTGSALHFDWEPHASTVSELLTGYRALMNDTSLLDSVDKIAKASMRSYMSAPNGDFIAWFPDYFGSYGTAGKMVIRDLELAGDAFSIVWDDERMVTHQYAVGALTGISTVVDDPGVAAGDLYSMITTEGIASVEFPELMRALFNIPANDKRANGFLNTEAILKRFGARPDVARLGMVVTPAMEFWYACRMFQKHWAAQFSSTVNLTFMPEVWPGMLIQLESFGFQAYVTQVTHTFDFLGGMGNGFRTDVSIIAPSSIKGGGLYGLPGAGIPGDGNGNNGPNLPPGAGGGTGDGMGR